MTQTNHLYSVSMCVRMTTCSKISNNNHCIATSTLFATLLLRNSLRSAVDSIRDAVLTVSPNKQYLGIVKPTTPATTGPVCKPTVKEI